MIRVATSPHFLLLVVYFFLSKYSFCAINVVLVSSVQQSDSDIYTHTHTHTHTHIVVVVQSPSYVRLFVTAWTAALQASLSLTISQSLPKFMSIEPVMPSNKSSCHPLLLLPLVFPNIRSFSGESALCIRWPKY